jgi:hypothetical protein
MASTPVVICSSPATAQAKLIVLGDEGTGKSSLVRNLNHAFGSTPIMKSDNFFTIIEIPADLLSHSSQHGVILKVWEHSNRISKQEEELALRGALFCIVTVDIRNLDSAHAAFNKWVNVKELYAPECFLFILGTHFDQANHRRVELKDICKSTAKRNGVYLEISNHTGQNIELLKKLLIQKIYYMLGRKEKIESRIFSPELNNAAKVGNPSSSSSTGGFFATERDSNEERKGSEISTHGAAGLHSRGGIGSTRGARLQHSVPPLEQHVLCDSVGSILSSCLDLEYWPGMEKENSKLEAIGHKISNFIEKLSFDIDHSNQSNPGELNIPFLEDAVYRSEIVDHLGEPHHHQQEAIESTCTLTELKNAFSILGLNFPTTVLLEPNGDDVQPMSTSVLLESHVNKVSASPSSNHSASSSPSLGAGQHMPNKLRVNRQALRRLVVKLPGGRSADMVIDLDAAVDQQIELFLLSNSLEEDHAARLKIVSMVDEVCRREGKHVKGL